MLFQQPLERLQRPSRARLKGLGEHRARFGFVAAFQ
jgi:hypothetical protein